MKMNAHQKLNRLPAHSRQANSGNFCSSMANPGFHPVRGLMICLGWLRLYQTILSDKSRTSHAKIFSNWCLLLALGVVASPTTSWTALWKTAQIVSRTKHKWWVSHQGNTSESKNKSSGVRASFGVREDVATAPP
jgi:hypothetical protein